MMFLTNFEFNTQRRQSRHVLVSAHRIHASVLASFPEAASARGRILWRLDHGDHGRRELWISSPTPPDLSALVETCGWPKAETWRSASLDPLLASLQAGQKWRFRLTANPVKVLPSAGTRGKPVPLTVSGHIPWLIQRAEKLGFEVGDETAPTVTVSRTETLRFSHGDSRRVTLGLSQFDGTLAVRDADALRTAMTGGIGRAKGYGAGLMTLAPLR